MGNSNTKEGFRLGYLQLGEKGIASILESNPGYWRALLAEGVSFLEICSLINYTDVLALRDRHPANLIALVTACLEVIEAASTSSSTSSAQPSSSDQPPPPPVVETQQSATSVEAPLFTPAPLTTEPRKFIATATYVLTRVMSILFALPKVAVLSTHSADSAAAFLRPTWLHVSFADALFWGACASSPLTLGARLLNSLISLYLLPTSDVTVKIALLRLLLVTLSGHLHKKDADGVELELPTAGESPRLSLWTEHLIGPAFPSANSLFTAALSVIAKFDPVGWGIPYNHLFSDRLSEILTNTVLQVMILLLTPQFTTFVSPLAHSILDCARASLLSVAGENCAAAADRGPAEALKLEDLVLSEMSVDAPVPNSFLEKIRHLNHPGQFRPLLHAVVKLLNYPRIASSSLLPGSVKSTNNLEELLMFLWIVIQENHLFIAFVTSSLADIEALLLPLLQLFLENRSDSTYNGLIHISTFVLLILSSERELAIRLSINCPHPITSPGLPSFYGTWADFIILALVKHIRDPHSKLKNLHECLLTIIANISPYIRNLGVLTCQKLLLLFEHFARPKFLLSDRRHHLFLVILLELFENIIQYQYEGNPALIYEIVIRRYEFEALRDMTFDQCVAQSLAVAVSPSTEPGDSDESQLQLSIKAQPELSSSTSISSTSTSSTSTSSTSSVVYPTPQATETALVLAREQPISEFTDRDRVWFNEWKPKLPLSSTLRLIAVLQPKLLEFCTESGVNDQAQIIEFIRNSTLVGLLPLPHPILIRRYQTDRSGRTALWFTPFIWNIILKRNSALFFWREGPSAKCPARDDS